MIEAVSTLIAVGIFVGIPLYLIIRGELRYRGLNKRVKALESEKKERQSEYGWNSVEIDGSDKKEVYR
jgi:hypothetical protein